MKFSTISWLIGAIFRCRASIQNRETWYSVAMLKPPWNCIARSAASKPASLPEELRSVRFRSAGLALVEQPCCLLRHQIGRLEPDPAVGERVRDRLVLADRAIEDDAVLGVLHRQVQRPAAEADGGLGHGDPLGVETVEQAAEALALLADDLVLEHLEILEDHLVAVHGIAHDLVDAVDLDALLALELRQEQRHAVEGTFRVARAGAGQKQDSVGIQRIRDPDLAAVTR